ncbi:MAG: response regulator [Pseudomonadota bacterium]
MTLTHVVAGENRDSQRRRMLKGGVIVFDCQHMTVPCVVRDISATGARLQVSEATAIPNTFELLVELDGLRADCVVIWRASSRVGVKFETKPKRVTPSRAQVVSAGSSIDDKPTLRRRQDALSGMCRANTDAQPDQSRVVPAERQTKRSRPIPLLIAEDDADDRFLISDAFKETGFEHPVIFVENGEELLSYLRREGPFADCDPPGLVMLDLNMPRMDGRTALMHIKTDPALKRIPVIAFTTSNAENDIERTYELGVSAFISKPGSFDEMLDLVESLNNHWMRFVALPNARA